MERNHTENNASREVAYKQAKAWSPRWSAARRRRLMFAALAGLAGTVALVGGLVGVSGTRVLSDQLSYLASGSVVGLFLLGVGGAILIGDFMTEQERAIGELCDLVLALQPGSGIEHVDRIDGPALGSLVAVKGAAKVHRPTCTLARDKDDLVQFSTIDEAYAAGLQACRICHPEVDPARQDTKAAAATNA